MKLKQKRINFINSTVGNNSQYVKRYLSMGAYKMPIRGKCPSNTGFSYHVLSFFNFVNSINITFESYIIIS